MKHEIKFDKPFYDDLPPDEKHSDEIIYMVMKIARGDIVRNRKYSNTEIEMTARKLVMEGFIRGTPLSNEKCVWSRLTRKGQFWLDITERQMQTKF